MSKREKLQQQYARWLAVWQAWQYAQAAKEAAK